MNDEEKTVKKVANTRRKSSPPRTPEAQEQLMINLSMKQAEEMLRSGRAPAQIVVHFLKLATEKTKYENLKLKADTELAKSKAEVLASQKHSDELYEKAIAAFKSYGGASQATYEDDGDGDYYDD